MDVIQIMMIQAIEGGLERCTDIREVHDPSRMRIDGPAQVQLDSKRMPVQSGAFVPNGHVRQAMRRLDGKGTENIQETPLAVDRSEVTRARHGF